MLYFPYKRLIAHILLLGQLLTSCSKPTYLHIGSVRPYRSSKSTFTPSSTFCRVTHTSPRPIPLPEGARLHFHQKGSSCWAELESVSIQPAYLPVTFGDGFTKEALVSSDPAWQEQYIHLHPDSSDSLQPSFVYIGPSAPPVEQPLDKVDSTANLASGFTPASSACSYTFLKDPGYKIVLSPDGDRWKAMVQDNRFPGLSRSYAASVAFEKGYRLEDFISKDFVYQSRHIHLLSTNKDRPMVYIGSFGLKGGGCCGRATWSCACGFQCPNGYCEACCNHKPHCSIIEQQRQQQQQQELWNAQEKRNRLSKDQEASAQWEKEEQLRQAAQAAQESRISQELESVKSERASAHLKRAKERRTRESIRQGIERENIKSSLGLQGDLLLYEKDISLTDSEAEEECELTTTTNKTASFDTNYYQLSEPSTSRLSDKAPLVPTPLSDSDSEEECELTPTTNKKESFDTSDYQLLEPSTSKLSDNELLAAPPVVDTFSFMPHFINQNKGLSRFCADSSSGYVSGVSSNSISEDSTQEFPEDLLSEFDSTSLSSLQSTSILKKYPSLSSLVCSPTYRPLPLRRSLSLESFSEQPTFQASILEDSSLDPINRFLAYYSYYLSSEDAVIFYAEAGKYISEKLPKSSSEVQQGVLNYFLDGGAIYPTVLANYPASDWLLHSLWHELAKDPIADPLSLETFQEYWISISAKYTKDQQTSLLQSLWKSKKKKELSLAKINDILDLILSTNTQGDELSYNEPLLDQLITLRNYWLRAKLGDLPQWSPDSSTCKQIADVLASSHLSINFIDDFLNQLKSAEEIDLSSLLYFLTFVKSQEIPEAILSTIISSDHSDQLNNPRSWLTSLAVQWLSMHLSQKDPNIPSSLFSSIYKKFDQDISVVPTITDFVIQHRSLVASNSSTFTSLLDLLYTYQASSDLCCSVLESLPNCVPSEWVSASDKLITDQLFFSSPPYSVEELIEQIVQKSPDCLQNTLSTDTTKSYTNLASHMLERVCRQHVVKSLQPCLKNELEFLKEVYYFAIDELIEKENSLHDKLDELRKEKREAYQAFDWLKSKHDSKITTIDSEKSDTIAQLDRIDKEEKEELSKTKKKEEELTKELGDKSKEKPKQPETAQDNTSKAKETEKQQLQSRLQSLNQQRSDLQVSFKEAEIAYEKEQAKLEKEEEDITDSLHSLKVTKQVYQEKIDKLSKVSINNFDNYESYNELLECLYTKINDTNLTVSSSFPANSLVNLRDKKISKWTREDLGIWASSLPKVIKSASSFSRHIVTIIAAIKRAIALSQGSSCDRYQLLQLLSVLFPFKENAWISTPVEDPLVVAMLASISALYMGQISLVTDDKRLPISKSQVKGYLPFFDLLKLQAIKRSSLSRMPTTSGSKIVYGSQSDFKENRSKLIDYEQLKKRQKALNISYIFASSIFTQDLNSQFSKKPISSWSVEELEQWSSYVQKESFPSKSIPPIEYIAVVKHAVNLAYGSTPSIGQLWALFAKLDNGLDQGGLTQQEQQDPLVLIMASAVEALQKKSPLLTASLPNISISDLKNQETFFSLLNLGNSRSDSTITPSNGNLLILPEASPSISIPLLTPVCSDISKSSIASSPLDIQLTACAPSELLAGSRTDVAVIDPTEEKSTASLGTSIVPISTTSISPMDPQENNISTNGPSGETASINKEVIIPSISSTELADSSIDRATTSAAPSVTESTSYKVLTKAYASVQAAYISPSYILKSSKDPSYNSFKDKPISSWTGEELSSWAKYLSDVYSPKRPKKSELIAVVKRAVELSHGFSPRDSQLLTLITLLPNSSKGRLAQVNTGEGKSLIVAMLAAIHALKGKNVDVVTTSTELSIPEVKKQKPFFSLLNLTVSENSKTSNKKAAYKSNIVYGTSADFQSDILHKEVSGDDIRGLRDHDIVLVDEVDSMLFDNRTHSVRLSSGNPGMNHLLLPLGTIWNYIQNITRHMLEDDGSTYFIVEDYIREGTHIELLSSPGENWQNYATKVDDYQSFITEKTSEHLGKLLRNLTSEEKDIYQSYIDQQYKLTLLESDKQALEEKIEKAKVPFDMPIWNKKSICEKLNRLESEKEVKEEEIKQVQVAIDSHPWKKEHYPIIDIPEHLHDFAKQQIPYWIKNALHALCSYSKNKHYKVINKKIVPVQFKETGVLQSGLVWSDGLTQFLQMKEGLPIDPEGVATNFISNVGFFRRYGNAIYGLTGTLGDASTQDFLSEIYGTDFVTIPPHKRITIKDNHHSPYLCKELAPIIVEKANWQPTIIQQSLYHAHQKRAVLVICESIKDANHLAEQLKKYYPSEKVFSYTGEDNFRKKEEEEVSSGEIIVATNIAGRGTDLKTSQQVENHGGLYVAVTFLPESYRVELQNVGRTARAGKKGMAQLILCQNSTITMAELKSERDRKEINAIEHAKEDAKRMLLQDALFQNFCELEKKYLPSAYDCENLRLAEKIIPQWEAYLSSRFTESKLKEEFQKWASKKKDTFQKKIVDESLSTRDQESLQSGFEGKVSSQYNDYKQQYKNQLLEKFRKRNPTISDELATCLSSGKAFTIEMPELAKIHKWGKAERKALEERWALWLKGKHIDHGPLSKALPLLEDFDQEFSSKIEQDAQQDNLITNPYFHVLKGNDWIEKQEYDQAIISFDRAIDLDPIFSVHAHYNKARALLSCDDNAGKPQEIAYSELKKAKTIISTIYRPNLLSFHKLVARFKAKTHTARDIQKLLDLVNQQENYIERACKIIEEAQKDEKGKWKDHNVKLTNKLVKSTFQPLEAGDYDKAIKEANINGLTNLFTVKEVIPISWASIVSVAIIGLAQVTAGVLMLCTTGTGLGLIKEGISDLITTVKSAIHGSFSWAAWATQKAISMAVSLLSAGWSSLKASCLSVKDAAKDLVLSSTKVAVQEEATKSVTKVLATEITKGITGELLHTAGKWVANKVLLEGIEDKIRSKVETALNEAFQSNEIVQKGLGEDIKNENKNWQKRFVAVGHRILAEKASLHPCLSMVKEIAKGVACNKVEYLDESLKAAGVLKMLAELNTFTQNFIEDFNNEVNNYKEEVNQSTEQIRNQTIENDTSDLTIMASAPCMDMEEGIIPIDKVADGTSYCSKEIGEENTLETNFENLGPSTNENLVSHFKSHISNKLINILHEGADPVTSYATSKLNNQFFKKIDAVNAEALNTIKVNRLLTRIGSEAAQQKNQTETAGKDKPKDDKETEPESSEQDTGKETDNSNKKQTQLSTKAKAYQKEFAEDGPKDRTAFATLAAVLGVPIHIYNSKGERTHVIENGKGPAIQLVFEPGNDNKPGHYGILSNDNIKNPDYHIDPNKQNCWLDAVMMQIPPEKFTQLGGTDGILKKGMKHMDANPDVYNQLCEIRNQVKQIDSTKLLEGGVTEWLNPEYWKALSEGNKEKIAEIEALHQGVEIALAKLACITGASITVGMTPAGILGAITAGSALSATLDPSLRKVIVSGNWEAAADHMSNHLPIFASCKSAMEAYKKGNYKTACVFGMLALAESYGLAKGIKQVVTGATRATTVQNLTKQGKVKQLGPMGDPVGRSILYKPEGWITKIANNKRGTKVVNPKDPGDYIRFSPKNPDARAPIGQQYNSFRRYKNGKVLTKDGQWVNPKTHPNKQDFHIPQDMFEDLKPLLELD